ncbi:MAG: hypothetical protein ACTSU2_10570 [Promethearchaeota archaeon]
MNLLALIISVSIIFAVIPFIGNKIYEVKSDNKRFFTFYLITMIIFLVLRILFSSQIDLSKAEELINIFVVEMFSRSFNSTFVLIILFYLMAGIGFFGGVTEKSAEGIEEMKLYSNLKTGRFNIKAYFFYIGFGYTFLYSSYSFSAILTYLLGLQYKPEFILIQETFSILQFNQSILIAVIGISLYSYKSFKYGFFYKEFFNRHPDTKRIAPTWPHILRRTFVIFLFVIGNYMAIMITIIYRYNLSNPIGPHVALDSMQLIFYIFVLFESLYFYTHMNKVVDELKISEDEKDKKKGKKYKEKVFDEKALEETLPQIKEDEEFDSYIKGEDEEDEDVIKEITFDDK